MSGSGNFVFCLEEFVVSSLVERIRVRVGMKISEGTCRLHIHDRRISKQKRKKEEEEEEA
jgi:hypothetical protein